MPEKQRKRKPGGGRIAAGSDRPGAPELTSYITLRLPVQDKIALRAKYGRGVNKMFKEWVKTVISTTPPD